MLLCDAFWSVLDDSSTGTVELLIAVVQQLRHSRFDIEDHLAKHTISPAEPKSVVSLRFTSSGRPIESSP